MQQTTRIQHRLITDAEANRISELMQKHPKLTLTELRICVLIERGLTSKEIAETLSSSLRNIENHRYRIRKKMEIGTPINLERSLKNL